MTQFTSRSVGKRGVLHSVQSDTTQSSRLTDLIVVGETGVCVAMGPAECFVDEIPGEAKKACHRNMHAAHGMPVDSLMRLRLCT